METRLHKLCNIFHEKIYNVRYVRVMVFPHPENFCYPVPNKLSWKQTIYNETQLNLLLLGSTTLQLLIVLNEKLWSRASVTDREKPIK